jgi:acetyl esterase
VACLGPDGAGSKLTRPVCGVEADMPLDSHVRRVLDLLAASNGADAAPQTPMERRDAFRKLMSLSDGGEAVGGVEDLSVPGADGPLRIRVYTPIGTRSGRLPALIYFHGGGLVSGSLDTHDGICKPLANAAGCRLFSVDYRLAPEHKFPAAVTDGCAATTWIARHAAELRIDAERIAVGGDSAGAALAAVVCQLAARAPGARLAAQLLLCPITDFAGETESRKAFAQGFLLDRETMNRDLEQYLPSGMDAADPRISPLRAADLGGLPPAYIHTAEFDPLRDEGRAYADRLAGAGVEVHYTCHPGMIHLFYGMARAVPYARTAIQRIGAEIRAALGRGEEGAMT